MTAMLLAQLAHVHATRMAQGMDRQRSRRATRQGLLVLGKPNNSIPGTSEIGDDIVTDSGRPPELA